MGIKDKRVGCSVCKTAAEKGAQNVLVSMAGEGAVLVAASGEVFEAPAPKGKLINGVGAGDSMVAGFMAGYMEKKITSMRSIWESQREVQVLFLKTLQPGRKLHLSTNRLQKKKGRTSHENHRGLLDIRSIAPDAAPKSKRKRLMQP